MSEQIKGKSFDVAVIDEMHDMKTAVKLEYLDRLIKIDGQAMALVEQKDVESRIKRVCDSIEQDLGIKHEVFDEYNVDRVPSKGGIVTKPGVSGVVATHAVTGMYKREWTQPDE